MWRGVVLFWPEVRRAILLLILYEIIAAFFKLQNSPRIPVTPLTPLRDPIRERTAKLSIHVFAWKRRRSLERLMNSLLKAHYPAMIDLPLFIHIDGNPLPEVVDYARQLYWPFGEKVVEVRDRQLGLPMAILDGWHPHRDDEWALLLEDDTAVSPHYMQWLQYCLEYTQMLERLDPEHGLMGCSLYTPIVNEIGPAPNAWSPPRWHPDRIVSGPLFNFQLPCSWGTLWHARFWRPFLHYHALRQQMPPEAMPPMPNSRSNEWFSSWKRILIELMLFKGWYLLYPSLPKQASFSTNYFEPGVHSVPEGQKPSFPDSLRPHGDRRFTVPFAQQPELALLPPLSNQTILNVPWVNLYHERVADRQALLHLLDPAPFLAAAGSPALTAFLGLPSQDLN